MLQNNFKQKGFTLIELLVVIAIIGVLSTLAVVALGGARTKARDSKRVADIKQISTALEIYYNDNGSYPTIITPGQSLKSPDGITVYMANVPSNPTPMNDSGCGNNNYTYSSTPNNNNYSLNFCLGSPVGSTLAGINSASSSGLGTAPGLVGWWKLDEGTGTNVIDSSGNENSGTWHGAGTHYVSGKTGVYAGQLNGSDDYIDVGNKSSLTMTNELTLTAWVYKKTTGSLEAIVGRWPQFNKSFMLRIEPSNTLSAQVSAGGGDNGQIFYSTLSVPLNQWSFISMKMDANNLYATLNNVTQSQARTVGDMTETAAINIGRIGFMTGLYYFNGYIDDVRVYNRSLATSEILALYNASK